MENSRFVSVGAANIYSWNIQSIHVQKIAKYPPNETHQYQQQYVRILWQVMITIKGKCAFFNLHTFAADLCCNEVQWKMDKQHFWYTNSPSITVDHSQQMNDLQQAICCPENCNVPKPIFFFLGTLTDHWFTCLFVYVCRLASQVSALGLYSVIKHRSGNKLNANTRSNQYTRYGNK